MYSRMCKYIAVYTSERTCLYMRIQPYMGVYSCVFMLISVKSCMCLFTQAKICIQPYMQVYSCVLMLLSVNSCICLHLLWQYITTYTAIYAIYNNVYSHICESIAVYLCNVSQKLYVLVCIC